MDAISQSYPSSQLARSRRLAPRPCPSASTSAGQETTRGRPPRIKAGSPSHAADTSTDRGPKSVISKSIFGTFQDWPPGNAMKGFSHASHSVAGWDKAGFEAAGPPFNEGVALLVGRRSPPVKHGYPDLVPPYESQILSNNNPSRRCHSWTARKRQKAKLFFAFIAWPAGGLRDRTEVRSLSFRHRRISDLPPSPLLHPPCVLIL
jgi:hypothetical protein